MPKRKKSSKKSSSSFQASPMLILPVVLLSVVLAYGIYSFIYATNLKQRIESKKDTVEGAVKTILSPAKVAELKVKTKKVELELASLVKNVNDRDLEDALKRASNIRSDVEEMWQDIYEIKNDLYTQEVKAELELAIKTQLKYLEKALLSAKGADINKLKLEINQNSSLLQTINQ